MDNCTKFRLSEFGQVMRQDDEMLVNLLNKYG